MTLFSHDEDPDDKRIYMKAAKTPASEFPEELSKITVEPSVIPEVQAIIDEVEKELQEEASGQLKKIIKERLRKIKIMENDLNKEKAALAALIQIGPEEYTKLTGESRALLKNANWLK